ncbi:MAG TPA: arginine deiminase family protein [Chitinophagales bacterium]|nr:arginine deiminase family protein [Chitinophagales bacterium]
MYKVWNEIAELKNAKQHWEEMISPKGILMVTPKYFDVVDVKNPYMKGQIGNVKTQLAQQQWNNLYAVFENWQKEGVIHSLKTIDGAHHLEDMVFCANPFFVWTQEDEIPFVLLSNMQFESRQAEVDVFEQYFKSLSIKTQRILSEIKIEGNGDLIPHPGKRTVWMGYGYRTDKEVAKLLTEILEAHIIPLKLVSEHFYHLDTCFCIINENHIAICKEAFDEESYQKIKAVFSFVHEISLQEAKNHFALNSLVMTSPSGDQWGIIPKNCDELQKILLELDVKIQEVDTSEFIKSGGSIYCMKAFLY